MELDVEGYKAARAMLATLTPEQAALVNRLNDYEVEFTARAEAGVKEALCDHWARMKSGLTCDGLMNARFYVGKFVSMKPGVMCYRDGSWGIVERVNDNTQRG